MINSKFEMVNSEAISFSTASETNLLPQMNIYQRS